MSVLHSCNRHSHCTSQKFGTSHTKAPRARRRSAAVRTVSTARPAPPQKQPEKSTRDKLGRAITSLRLPGRQAARQVSMLKSSWIFRKNSSHSAYSLDAVTLLVQLQQKALEVDSGRVSSAIQNLINSWKASDSESDQATETSSSGRQVSPSNDGTSIHSAGPSGKSGTSGSSSSPDPPPGEDEQQQEKRNRLLSLFYRGRNGQQQQPEELMPLRVTINLMAFAHVLARIRTQLFQAIVTTFSLNLPTQLAASTL